MEKYDARIDAYIQKSEPFAQPILTHIRQVVHAACPEATETVKWGFPHFEYHGVLCNMASFKKHCSFGFWKASLLSDPHKLLHVAEKAGMGHFGQIQNLADLPADGILTQYIQEAAKLNKENIKKEAKPKAATSKQNLVIPEYFQDALNHNEKAKQVFDNFSYSNQKEYITWLTDAKTEATRLKRQETALEWIAEGKSRNWKYEKV